MSNPNAGFGFRPYGHIEGSAPNFGITTYQILYSYGTALYRGDVVILSSGYINGVSPGTEAIAGIFWGCHYNSAARKLPIYSPYWPGSDALTSSIVLAYVITDPNALFLCQTDGTAAIGQSGVGALAQFVAGTGSTVTGISGQTLNHTTGSTTTYPFRVLGLLSANAAPGTPGTDDTSAYNQVIVGFNNQLSRVTAVP